MAAETAAVDQRRAAIKALAVAGTSKTVELGKLLIEHRKDFKHGEWIPELDRLGLERTHAATAIKAANDPEWHRKRREAQREGNKRSRSTKKEDVVIDNNIPPSAAQWTEQQWKAAEAAAAKPQSMPGEGSEAWRGLKAALHRAGNRPTERTKWLSTARGHFRKLLELSSLPAVAGTTIDEILEQLAP